MPTLTCPQCRSEFTKCASEANRAQRIGAPLYCGRACAGLARRSPVQKTAEQKVAAKAAYDAEYREKNRALLKAKKAAHYEANRDPEKERAYRAANMHKHVAYCRTPEYRAKKAAYDKRKRFEAYGPYEDAARLLEELEREINARASRYEIYLANGRFTRSAQQRRRDLWQLINNSRT